MTTEKSIKVGVVGLGIMGMAFARNLMKSGFVVIGCDLNEHARQLFIEAGGTPADTPAAVAAESDHLLLSLPSVEALHAVVGASDGLRNALRPGMVVADLSTLPIDAKEAAQCIVTATGAKMLDCPVSGTGAQAVTGDLVVFASGDVTAIEALVPAFEAIARDVRRVGAFGCGMKLKYVANLLVAIHNLAAAEALMLAERSGLDLDMVFEAIRSGAGNSRMFEVRGPLMVAHSYKPATMKAEVFQKDVSLIMTHAQAVQSPVPLMAACLPYYSAAMAQGRAVEDTACVFGVLRQLCTPMGKDGAAKAR